MMIVFHDTQNMMIKVVAGWPLVGYVVQEAYKAIGQNR